MTQELRKRFVAAAADCFDECRTEPPVVRIETSSDPRYGHYSTNLAMQLAPVVKDGPMRIAQKLISRVGTIPGVAKIDVVAPGFMNVTVEPAWFERQVAAILRAGKSYGQTNVGRGERVLVEFVSANPTGPIHVGNGRGAFIGDTIANVLTAAGYRAFREFYVNDAGQQVDTLAESVIRRSFQLQGVNVDYPDELYQGEYVKDLARRIHLPQYKLKANDLRARIRGRVLNLMIAELRRVMERQARVRYDRWYRESELSAKHLVEQSLELLRAKGLTYVQDGATWFRTTTFGDDKDRVLVKSDGSYTYLAPDVALRLDRFVRRKFDREIILLGADHHGYEGRLKAAVAALGFPGKIEVRFMQLVRLLRGGQELKMSKRAGTYVALEELIADVGLDAARFFFLLHAPETHMDFDLDLAKERSEQNPVYYVQYAHARIASIIRKARRLPTKRGASLAEPAELGLIQSLLRLPDLVTELAASLDVHKLPFYARDLATAFHAFYTKVRVIDEGTVDERRLALVRATQLVLARTLGLMGVSAPDKM